MTTGTSGAAAPRVLVPLDGSPFSEYALPLAARLARLQNAELDLARAHLPIAVMPAPGEFALPAYEPTWDREARDASRAYLQERCDRLEREYGVRARPVLLDGRVAQALEEYVRGADVTLVVTTTHGRGGISRVVQGSVVDELVRLVDIPVITLRPPDDLEGEAPPEQFSRILVPLDGSDTAARVLAPATRLAELTAASLVLLHVITPSAQARASERPEESLIGDPANDPLAAEGLAMLEQVAAPLRERGLTVDVRVSAASDPAASILAVAEQEGVDCIAIATHGRGGLTRLLFGSVADRVFRGAQRPVLLLRDAPAERGAVDARAPEMRGT